MREPAVLGRILKLRGLRLGQRLGSWLIASLIILASIEAAAAEVSAIGVPAGQEATAEPAQSGGEADVADGFVAEGDFMLVRAHCTACHSSKLVTQNRADRDGWKQIIRWMQATQNLWDLGESEEKVLDYLATYYGPLKQGRRQPLVLKEGDWYRIDR
ncbi:MAG: hypothetical protein ACREIA_17745 [Opitutaceae bacterium]